MMALTKQKRKDMEELIYKVFTALDPSLTNTNKYKALFGKMSDAQFDAYFKKIFADDNIYLVLDVVDFEHDTNLDNIEKAANILKVPLMEYVAMPFVNKDKENPVTTKHRVVVGYLHLKRMQQLLSKKNSTSTDIGTRSALTGQVTGNDKSSRISDVEMSCLTTVGATNALREFMGPRSDDKFMKAQMYSDIATKGYCSLETMSSKIENKTSLNTTNVYMLGMMLKSDLVTKGLVLNKTLDED
jgi:hypothetical protein